MKILEDQLTPSLLLNKGDNTDSISPILSEDENQSWQKYQSHQKLDNLYWKNKIIKSFSLEKDSRLAHKFSRLNRRLYLKDKVYFPHHLDSSPSVNSERNELSNNRQQISENHFDNLTQLNQNMNIQNSKQRVESDNYLNNLEWQESQDLNEFNSSLNDNNRLEKLLIKNKAIYPPNIRRNKKLEENKLNIKEYSSVKKETYLRKDLSNYNDNLMNEKCSYNTPLNNNSNTKLKLKLGMISENIPETPVLYLRNYFL